MVDSVNKYALPAIANPSSAKPPSKSQGNGDNHGVMGRVPQPPKTARNDGDTYQRITGSPLRGRRVSTAQPLDSSLLERAGGIGISDERAAVIDKVVDVRRKVVESLKEESLNQSSVSARASRAADTQAHNAIVARAKALLAGDELASTVRKETHIVTPRVKLPTIQRVATGKLSGKALTPDKDYVTNSGESSPGKESGTIALNNDSFVK